MVFALASKRCAMEISSVLSPGVLRRDGESSQLWSVVHGGQARFHSFFVSPCGSRRGPHCAEPVDMSRASCRDQDIRFSYARQQGTSTPAIRLTGDYVPEVRPDSQTRELPTESAHPPAPSAAPLDKVRRRLGLAFDHLYGPRPRAVFRRAIVYLALGGLGVHAGLVFLARTLDVPPPLIAAVGTNYLSALYTPFSFVLFYEVLLLQQPHPG